MEMSPAPEGLTHSCQGCSSRHQVDLEQRTSSRSVTGVSFKRWDRRGRSAGWGWRQAGRPLQEAVGKGGCTRGLPGCPALASHSAGSEKCPGVL